MAERGKKHNFSGHTMELAQLSQQPEELLYSGGAVNAIRPLFDAPQAAEQPGDCLPRIY